MWTLFWDMHSGGGTKEGDYDKIYIEAPKKEAVNIFYRKFHHSPFRVSCTCCGEDYTLSESKSLEDASAYHRDCKFDKETDGYTEESEGKSYSHYKTIEEYCNLPNVLIIRKEDITDREREEVDIPEEGYVWK